ncbi:MAG TPA: D-alanyl-D-alanine carboxypeptidase family protein [Bacillales bacterium]|nr:D-alanyl-D-alanine carboxypeptidase family protein [Bacillales bacterium]
MLKKPFSLILSFTIIFFLLSHNFAASETSSLNVSAKNAVLMESESGRVLFAKDAHEKQRIASITKIMTAILAIESGKLEKKVTISKRSAYTEGSSLYLKPGEKIRLKDLVYGLMLRSGNDAAVAIAEFVGGSVEGFTQLMNEKAAQIGMTDTVFANPHGLDDHRNMYSTAYDMALLTKYAMKNPTFRKIWGTKTYRVEDPDGSGVLVWKNKNKLLTRYPYATGGKTGYTTIAKRTLVSTAKKDGMSLIVVTLNDRNDWEDHMNLFNWGFQHYDLVPIAEKGVISGLRNDFYKGKVLARKTLQYPLTEEEMDGITKTVNLYKPPKKGRWKNEAPSPVGKMFVQLNNDTIAELPLYYKGDPDEKKGFWSWFKEIFLITAGVRING